MKKVLSIMLCVMIVLTTLTALTSAAFAEAPGAFANAGGTASYDNGTFTAVAYYGNTFRGWYDNDGNRVSTAAVFTTDEYTALTADFFNNNQVVDGDFSAGTGVAFWKANTTSSNFVNSEGAGVDGKGLNVVTKGNCLMTAKIPVSVKKNTNYVFSYNMKINSYGPTQKLDEATGEYVDLGTPVFSPMVSGSPDGTAGWGHWPKLGNWKITIRNAEDYSKTYTLSGTKAVCQPQIKYADIVNACGDGWLEFIFEFNTGDDTTYSNDGNIFETSDVGTMVMATGVNYAVSNMDFDNFSFYEASYSPVFNHKENVSTTRVGISTVAAGSTYSFKINKAEGTEATVVYNKKAVAPVNGVYTLNLVNDKNVYISLSNDSDYPEMGKDFAGNDLTAYDHTLYNIPIWEGNTVYHENAIFYPDRNEIELIYPIDKVVSVRSFDLQQYYVEGVDFEIRDGKLVRLPDSSIPVLHYSPYSPAGSGSWASDDPLYDITGASAGSLYPRTLAITYEHSKTWADLGMNGYTETKQESVTDSLTVFDKLCNGEDVHIVFYGDSMTSGWSISGGLTYVYTAEDDGTLTDSGHYTAPFAPSWMQMFVEGLRKEYPTSKITYENLSLGGKDSKWGLQHFEARYNLLKNKDIDLFLLGWGINDCGTGRSPADYKVNEQAIIDALRAKNPDASVLMYSGNCTNVEAAMYNEETMRGYEAAITDLALENDNAAATVLTSLFFDTMNSKKSLDLFENNLNHTNDFGCRFYSQVMLSAMKGEHSYSDSVITKEYTDDQKALTGYDADQMGDDYTLIVGEEKTEYNVPVDVTAGEQYLVHLKVLPLSFFGNGSALTVSADMASTVRLSTKNYSVSGTSFSAEAWNSPANKAAFGNGFVDVYALIDAEESGTANLTIAQPAGGILAIDAVTAVNVKDFSPTLKGATFAPMADPDGKKIMYVTNVSIPSYLGIGKISTYMGVTNELVAAGKTDTFTTADENVTAATLSAYKMVGYIAQPGTREVFRNGDIYAVFSGADEVNGKVKFSVRTVIDLTDAYGNSLSLSVSSNNNGNGTQNGVYSRSVNQVKRLLAKALIESSAEHAKLAADMITYDDATKLYNGPIEQVWDFVVTASNPGFNDNPGTFPEIDEEGTDDLI